jgi:hypothetical protein
MKPDGGAVPGTVVLYGSVSAMEVESTESYAGKWKQGRNAIKRSLGDVMVIPVIPITPSGIRNRKAIRSLLDVSAWINDLEEPELRFIRNTRKNFEDVNLGRVDKGWDGLTLTSTTGCRCPWLRSPWAPCRIAQATGELGLSLLGP